MSVQAAAVASELDVAIIGGGPGGLAAAHAVTAAAPHLKVAVLERVPQLIRRGAGFSLAVNGQKALRAISPGGMLVVGMYIGILCRRSDS